jgi:hypothetical protein
VVLVTGCVTPDSPGVQVRMLAADLVFGVPDEKPEAAVPADVALELDTPVQAGGPPAIPPLPEFPDMPQVLAPPAPEGLVPCPPAGPNEFPDIAAARNVDTGVRPAPGVYRWKTAGKRKAPDTLNFEITLKGFFEREIKAVKDTTGTHFSYQTVQTDILTADTVVTTYVVRTDVESVRPAEESGFGDQPLLPEPAPTITLPNPSLGPPDRGITIERIERFDKKGKLKSTFEPVTPLLLLPLPVVAKTQFQSSAVDPTSFQTITWDGTVKPAERVDACGELVEGWLVTGTMQVSDGQNTAVTTREFVFAPQLGGTLVREKIVQESAAINMNLEHTLGQVQPDKPKKKQD